MKKILFFVLLTLAVVSPQTVSAHVLIRDKEANVGAIFHLTPDDDPIAGEDSILYFDIQDQASLVRIPYDGYDLFITNDQDTTTQVETATLGSSVSAQYLFPGQGVYKLELRSQPKYDVFQKVSLTHTLRVDRGIIIDGRVPPTSRHAWAEILLILSISSLILIAIYIYNNRHNIVRQSSW